jgi:hypothetical protein
MDKNQINSSENYNEANLFLIDINEPTVRPRCLSALPLNIEELIAQFKIQGTEIISDQDTFS